MIYMKNSQFPVVHDLNRFFDISDQQAPENHLWYRWVGRGSSYTHFGKHSFRWQKLPNSN